MSTTYYNMLKSLINKKYYATAEEAQSKVDGLYAKNKLTEEEMTELSVLIIEVYGVETK